jgi:hypothetical protein
MTGTSDTAPAVVTPGQADWEARRDSSFARAGLPAGDQFVSWHLLPAEDRADAEAGAQAAIAAAPPAVTVDALAAVLDGRELLVTRVHSAPGDSVWLATPARPRDLAVQLLSAIDMRLTDDPEPEEDGETPGYWQARTALTAATHALQLVKLGTDDKLAAIARDALAKVDAVLEGAGDPSGASASNGHAPGCGCRDCCEDAAVEQAASGPVYGGAA